MLTRPFLPPARLPSARGRHRLRRPRLFRVVAAALVVLVAAPAFAATVVAAPAVAAAASLSVEKTVDDASLVAGDEFAYTIDVACYDSDCFDVVATDVLPAEFAGFTFVGAPTVTSSSVTTAVTLAGCDVTGGVTTIVPGCTLAVAATTVIDGEVGVTAGDGFTVAFALKVPQNLTPEWAFTGDTITNPAAATASNTASASDSADVVVTIPVDVAVTVGKTWQPASQQFQPGVASTLALSIRNTSNMPAGSLSLQDPKAAAEGDAALAASNPFLLVDFASFDAVVMPQGADRVQVDAYVLEGGVWTWKTGTPAPSAVLPAGVSAPAVAGLRVTFTDSVGSPVIAASGTAGTVELTVAQRATDRVGGASLVHGATASNTATGTVVVPGQDPKSADALAPYAIGGLTVLVDAKKTITPADIPAGGTAAAQISGRNDSNGPLSSFTVADVGFFTDEVLFGGFSAAPAWPLGASAGSITWYVVGVAQTPVAFVNGDIPVAPAGTVTGFSLAFTGAIAVGATAGANFGIRTVTSLVPTMMVSPMQLSNTIVVTGVNPAGTATENASAPLDVFFPEIGLSLTKTISPAAATPIPVGGTVVVQLQAITDAASQYVRPDGIVISDEATGGVDDFWNAFTPIAIAPTQVPLGAVLTVEYRDGSGWHPLPGGSSDATAEAKLFTFEIPTGMRLAIVGLRYTFTDADNFGQGTSVSPNTVFEARSTLRSSGDPVAASTTTATEYTNVAVAQATGLADVGTRVVSDEARDEAPAGVVANPGDGVLYAGKRWLTLGGSDLTAITAQSGDAAVTRLSWGVPVAGYSAITISDPASGEGTPEDTTFQAFDLERIQSLSFAASPLLAWDRVGAVELYYGGTWNVIAAPAGTWMSGTGFKGYTLTSTQRANTTGVRITVVPNDAARAASSDPRRPAADSGVATGAAGASRNFGLQWILRNTVRVPDVQGIWATGSTEFNLAGTPGTVRNTMAVGGTRAAGAVTGGLAYDDITLVDFPPNVDLTVGVDRTTVVIPNPGDVAPADYPAIDITLNAENTAFSRASYLRVTAGETCAGAMSTCTSAATGWAADPFTDATYGTASAFERVDLTGLTFTVPAAQVSKDHSMVTLWLRAAGGSLSTAQYTITAAEALPESALASVVGVSVVYQGTDPASDGGSIVNGSDLVMVLQTRLRETLRSGGPNDFVVPVTVNGIGFAQSYDPVLRPIGADSTPFAAEAADFVLTDGVLAVTAGKSFTPSRVFERNRADSIQVRLTATDGASTAPTHRVTLTDTAADFWDSVTLTGLGAVSPPAGADRVRVDVQTGGSAWTIGTAGPVAVLPAVTVADATGIRFTFDRADGGLFSNSAIPADWSTTALLTVVLRDTLRSTGGAIDFPGTVLNRLNVESARTDDPQVFAPATAQVDAVLTLDTGTFALNVVKAPKDNVHTTLAGEEVPWTLTFRNTGTGYLTVEQLVDTLPSGLTFTQEEPVYTTSAGGTLSTAVELDADPVMRELRFTWPGGGQRMSPGETFTIAFATVLEVGAPNPTTNSYAVTTRENLTVCTNDSGNGQGTLGGLSANQCGTSNFVQQVPGSNVASTKGVRGEIDGALVDGAVNITNAARACVADSDGYYLEPCAALTVVGATDEWKLRTVNSGTGGVTAITVVEPLPTAGDRMLAGGGPRGSTWHPVFDETFGVDTSRVPAGTTATWQVSTDANVCVGAGATSTWSGDPTCAGNTWVAGLAFTGDWAQVTGVRVMFDFTATATGSLAPGEDATVLLRTVNTPATAADTSLAPVTVPVSGHYAWNQFGSTTTFLSNEVKLRSPKRALVTLASGSLEVVKETDGAASAHAPAAFQVDVACTAAGASLDLGASAQLTLDTANSLRARIDGIPLGSECSVTESGAVGAFGETSRSGEATSLAILLPTAPTDPVPAAQIVTITNDYGWGSLAIAKIEDRTFATLGETVTYTLAVENTGVRTARNLVITDTLPDTAALKATNPTAAQSGRDLTWPIAVLAPGERVEFTVAVTYAEQGRHLNRASVTNPTGPWRPVQAITPCEDDPESACTNVNVTALAFTGVGALDIAIVLFLILTLGGGAAIVIERRMRRAR